jgi:integrase
VSIYKQPKSPHWLIEIQIGGRRFRRSSKTTSKRQAQSMERAWRTELEAPAPLNQPPPLTLGEAMNRYFATLVHPRNRPRTTAARKYLDDRLRRELGVNTLLSAITSARIAAFSDRLIREGKAPATVNRYLSTLGAMLRKAWRDWGALTGMPSIPLFKLHNERYRWLSGAEEERLLQASADHLRDLLIFLLDTGARLSEATELTWVDVQLDRQPRGMVKFMVTKSGLPRGVPLTRRTEQLLRRLRDACPGGQERVFLHRQTGRRTAFHNRQSPSIGRTRHSIRRVSERASTTSASMTRGIPLRHGWS